MQNQMELTFSALPQNEAFARVAIAAFAVQLNPTLPEMADIKTAVSEAVTNAIVHGYRGREDGLVRGRGGQRRGQGDNRHHAQIHHRRGRVAP